MVWTAMLIQCQIQSFIVTRSYAKISQVHVPVEHASAIKDLHYMRLNYIHISTMITMDLHSTGQLNVSNTKAMVPILKTIANG